MKKRKELDVTLIVQRQGGHANVSGYDRFVDYIDGSTIKRVYNATFGQKVLARLLKRWYVRSGSKWYGKNGLLTELLAARAWLKRSGQVFHFVYGENAYRYLGLLKKFRSNLIVCTYHTPPQRFAEVVRERKHLRHVDAIVLVSNASRSMFARHVGEHRIHFLPHGVDTDYFHPKDHEASKVINDGTTKCLFVGSHLRDFELLVDVAKILEVSSPRIQFEVITLPINHHHFAGLPNVQVRSGITDEELRLAYQNADVLTLPLLDATANNSLLEAMACGLPIISTDLSGVRDYVAEDCAHLVKIGDVAGFAQSIKSLSDDPERRSEMAHKSRARALDLSFGKVAGMTEELYSSLLASA